MNATARRVAGFALALVAWGSGALPAKPPPHLTPEPPKIESYRPESSRARDTPVEAQKSPKQVRAEQVTGLADSHGHSKQDVEKVVRDYERAIGRLGEEVDSPLYRQVAIDAADAWLRREPKYAPLLNEYSWLRARITGTLSDVALLGLTTIAARLAFSQEFSLNTVSVVISGLGRQSSSRIESSVPTRALSNARHLPALLAKPGVEWNSPIGQRLLISALESLKGELLMVVAHHEGGNVLFSDTDSKTWEVPVSALESAARNSGVKLFFLGCSTGTSTALGTLAEVTPDQISKSLSRLFSSEVSTYGDILKGLVDDGLLLTFDLRFNFDRKLEVLTNERGSISTKGWWTLPKLDIVFTGPGYSTQSLVAIAAAIEQGSRDKDRKICAKHLRDVWQPLLDDSGITMEQFLLLGSLDECVERMSSHRVLALRHNEPSKVWKERFSSDTWWLLAVLLATPLGFVAYLVRLGRR